MTMVANRSHKVQLPQGKPSSCPARILFFDHTAALGGGEIALLNLVNHLDRGKVEPVVVLGAEGPLVNRLKSQIETHVLVLPESISTTKKDSLGIATLFRIRDGIALLTYVWRLRQFIRQERIDLIHTNSLKADLIGGVAARLARRPVVWHVRDRITDEYLPRSVVRIFRILCRVIPTYVIANSAATLRTISTDFQQQSKTMGVVHDGTIIPEALEWNRKQNQVVLIGLIGRISPWKGQHIFLRAAAQVAKRFPNARFNIIGAALFGEDRYDREVRALPKQLGIENVVEFSGFRDDIHAVFADLDLVVHASTIGEPFGQVIIEGMAAGKPVVATNGGGVPEIVQDEVTGLLVPMGDVQAMVDAICAILADPQKSAAMGEQARQRVEKHFTVGLTARRVEAIYQHVLESRKTAPTSA